MRHLTQTLNANLNLSASLGKEKTETKYDPTAQHSPQEYRYSCALNDVETFCSLSPPTPDELLQELCSDRPAQKYL
jgi:hypothetical protein